VPHLALLLPIVAESVNRASLANFRISSERSPTKDEGKLAGLRAKEARGFLSYCGCCPNDRLL